MTTFTDQESAQPSMVKTDPEPDTAEPQYDGLTISDNKSIPIPEHVEPEPQKRGFLSRFFLPNG